jgi:hypothetical protein
VTLRFAELWRGVRSADAGEVGLAIGRNAWPEGAGLINEIPETRQGQFQWEQRSEIRNAAKSQIFICHRWTQMAVDAAHKYPSLSVSAVVIRFVPGFVSFHSDKKIQVSNTKTLTRRHEATKKSGSYFGRIPQQRPWFGISWTGQITNREWTQMAANLLLRIRVHWRPFAVSQHLRARLIR